MDHSNVVWNKQESRCKYWAPHSSVHSFTRTAHSFACTALLALLARSAALTHLLARSLHSLPRSWESEFLMSYNDLVFSHSALSRRPILPCLSHLTILSCYSQLPRHPFLLIATVSPSFFFHSPHCLFTVLPTCLVLLSYHLSQCLVTVLAISSNYLFTVFVSLHPVLSYCFATLSCHLTLALALSCHCLAILF